MNDFLRGLLPIIGSALGGPGAIAALAANWIAGKLDLPNNSVESVSQAIAGMNGEQLVKVKELEADLAKFLAENSIKLDMGQIETNKLEAQHRSIFVAGWRPYLGWICGTGVGYQFIFRPISNGVLDFFFSVTPFVSLDLYEIMLLLGTLLGASWLRNRDKSAGVDTHAFNS